MFMFHGEARFYDLTIGRKRALRGMPVNSYRSRRAGSHFSGSLTFGAEAEAEA
jgi:hypothetical protein